MTSPSAPHDPTDQVLRFLRDPKSYAHETHDFAVEETHISWVFLVGPYAYKLKKPLSLGFLDYSTPELRRRHCHEELRLNRRLAPAIYLDVLSLRLRDGRVGFAAAGEHDGEEVDSVVQMRRVPREAMLDALIRDGAALPAHIDQLVALLVPFYRAAATAKVPENRGRIEDLRQTLIENFESTRDRVGELISPSRYRAIRSAQLSFLTLEEDLLRRRRAEGWVRDGHGDLRAEHVVYLPDPPGCAVIDCVEFNDRLRVTDIAADLAFLKMDLEFLGASHLGEHLIARFEAESGDRDLRKLLDFYSSYRAYVRGKVDSIKLEQSDPLRRSNAGRRRVKRYFELAHYHALACHRPLLILVGGLSGSGKSTLAAPLAERLGAVHLRSDEIRKELAGMGPDVRAPASFAAGLYSPEQTRKTYTALAERAESFLAEGVNVVADATFSRAGDRELLRAIARRTGAKCLHLECRVAAEVAAERMNRRARDGVDPSDATVAIQAAQRAAYEPGAPGETLGIDTEAPIAEVLERTLELLRAH